MALIDTLERGVLFRLTRALAMLFIVGVCIATVVSGVVLFSMTNQKSTTTVQSSEVLAALHPDTSKSDATSQPAALAPEGDPLAELKVPFSLQKNLDSENVPIIRGWLRRMPENKRAEALEELGKLAESAEKANIPISDALNKYRDLKFERLDADVRADEQRRYSLLAYAGSVATGIIVIALFSLILVLLAVERNTRPAST
jgi:hypothetical protein